VGSNFLPPDVRQAHRTSRTGSRVVDKSLETSDSVIESVSSRGGRRVSGRTVPEESYGKIARFPAASSSNVIDDQDRPETAIELKSKGR